MTDQPETAATTRRYFSTFQLILLALFAALVVVAKIALRLPLQLPGHSGIFWMTIVVVAAGVVHKPGAASLVGLTSGIIAGFLGLGDFGALNTFLSYTAVGVGADLTLWLLGGNAENLMIATLAATFGHMMKFLVKWGFGIVTGAPVGFVALGLLRALLGYVIFGALGGLLGALTLKALRRAGFFQYLAEKR
ncbi:MAG: ECF transporter S component [Anaerolineae bacterium]|nr:ECF transporter S component [Anaerolineae bacterium]